MKNLNTIIQAEVENLGNDMSWINNSNYKDTLKQSLTNLTRHIIQGQIKLVESMGIDPNFDGNWRNGHYQALDTIKQSLQEQLDALNV